MIGDQSVIAPGEEIAALGGGYTIDVGPGDVHSIEFFDMFGRPAHIPAILNGDAMGGVSRVRISNGGEAIRSLAAPDSGFLVRRGDVAPKRPFATGALDSYLLSGVSALYPMAVSTPRVV